MGRRAPLAVLASIVLLGVLGCGAASTQPPASLTTIQEASQPVSRSQAFRTCAEVTQRLKSVRRLIAPHFDAYGRPTRSLGLASTLSKVRAALVPLARLHPPASDAHAFHLMVAKLNAAIVWDAANSAKLFALGHKFDALSPVSPKQGTVFTRLVRFENPVFLHDFDREYFKPVLAPGIGACINTVYAAQDDLFPVPPFSH